MRVTLLRATRLALAGLLLIVGFTGGAFGWALLRGPLATGRDDVTAHLDRILAAATDIGAAQGAYVGPGQPRPSWLQRANDLQRQLRDDANAIGSRLHAPGRAESLRDLTAHVEALAEIDVRIRAHLLNGQDLSAADLIFADARHTIAAVTASVTRMQQDERAADAADRRALARNARALLGSAGALWVLGLLIAWRAPAIDRATAPPARATVPEAIAAPPPETGVVVPDPPPNRVAHQVDLVAAADVCTAIAQVTSVEALPGLLARVAAVLDAQGIIVWMGAGDDLFAAAAHGYDPRVLSRLGPIGRESNNATAAAWRFGELQVVASDVIANGAVAAPMFGVDACVGVLAAEVRNGGESDQATQAVMTMIAAQLAAVIAAWPGADRSARTQAAS